MRSVLAIFRIVSLLALSAVADVKALAADPLVINEPGKIKDGFGVGIPGRANYAPRMGPAFIGVPTTLRSQISERGGYRVGGDQCSAANYETSSGASFQWYDTYCETRSGNRSSLCAAKGVHQGLDIVGGTRATCRQNVADDAAGGTAAIDNVRVYAVADGQITKVGTYSINLNAAEGVYKYLHLNMRKLAVQRGDTVQKGDFLGYMSRDFGGERTTYHLHLELWKLIGTQNVPVPFFYTYAMAQAKHEGRELRIAAIGRAAEASTNLAPDAGRIANPATTAAGIGSMIASYWQMGELEFGLVASGTTRLFVRTDSPAGMSAVFMDAEVIKAATGQAFYQGTLASSDAQCGVTKVPFGGPVVNDGFAVELTGFIPKFGAGCSLAGWDTRVVRLTYARSNAGYNSDTVDIAAIRN